MAVDSTEMSTSQRSADGSILHDFLSNSKWWAARNDNSVQWDGRCSFVPVKDDDTKESSEQLPFLASPGRSLRRSVRSFGKKDLISAWNSVLRTPRLVRRREHTPSTDRGFSPLAFPYLEPDAKRTESFGVTDVWRKLMDQIFDVAHRADIKRLGDDALLSDYGEFRHHLTEKYVFNKINRAAGKEILDVSVVLVHGEFDFHMSLLTSSFPHLC